MTDGVHTGHELQGIDIDSDYPNGHDIVEDSTDGYRTYRCRDCNMTFLTARGIKNRRFCPI